MADRRQELRERLGRWGTAAGRELDALTAATAGEQVAAAVYGVWRRRGWIVVATDAALHMSRRPRIFGRDRTTSWPWSELREVRAGAQRVDLVFGDRTLELNLISPHREFVQLADAARNAMPGSDVEVRTEELRELAKRKLGRTLAFGFEGSIDSLADRLVHGEHVERLATARLDFDGLLVVTNRRVILFDVGVRRGKERLWEVDRGRIRGAEATGDGLRLDLDSGPVTFTAMLPDERREELAAALWRG